MKLKQSLTYYEIDSKNKYGKFTFKPSTVISCRWEDKKQFIRKSAIDAFMVDGIIYTDTPIKLGSFVELTSGGTSTRYQVKRAYITTNLSNTKTLYTTYL